MTTTAEKVRRILDAEKRTGKRVDVTFNYRYAPTVRKIKELLNSGVIGDVTSIDFHWFLDNKHGADYFRRWHAVEENSGSLFVHKSTHHFDLMNWYLDDDPEDVSALCAACHEVSQTGLPVIVVGAGLPHLPAVLSASKSYSERLFRYQRIDRLPREAADQALVGPAADEGCAFAPEALEAMYAVTAGYPYFIQAYGKVVWDVAPTSPISAEDIRVSTFSCAMMLA